MLRLVLVLALCAVASGCSKTIHEASASSPPVRSFSNLNAFEEMLADYRSAQIKLVWEVNPTFRYVRVHHPDRTSVFLEANDTLTGETVLPGFSVKVADMMPAG